MGKIEIDVDPHVGFVKVEQEVQRVVPRVNTCKGLGSQGFGVTRLNDWYIVQQGHKGREGLVT